jgi:hypothetical protein
VRDDHLRRVVSVILLTLVSSACDKSPAERPARLLEQAASWAAAARYGDELHAKGEVPAAYLKNIAETGADELLQIRTNLLKSQDLPAAERNDGVSLTDQLRSLVISPPTDDARLEALEKQLHELADRVRRQ